MIYQTGWRKSPKQIVQAIHPSAICKWHDNKERFQVTILRKRTLSKETYRILIGTSSANAHAAWLNALDDILGSDYEIALT